jgi:hypothetical protein
LQYALDGESFEELRASINGLSFARAIDLLPRAA